MQVGDIWNREVDRIHQLASKEHTLCEEMESYAIGKIASSYQIPYLAVRVISNHEGFGEEYDGNLGTLSQEFVIALIKNL